MGLAFNSSEFNIDQSGTLVSYTGKDENVAIPEGVKCIGEDAFLNNTTMVTITVPHGVETIDTGAFWLCKNLRSISLPGTIVRLGDDAFNSSGLTEIDIPKSCKEIGDNCFSSCRKLRDIYIPASVKSIGEGAFSTKCISTVIHTEHYCYAETYAKENKIEMDHKMR